MSNEYGQPAYGTPEPPRRRKSRVWLIAAVAVGALAAGGIALGVALAGGGGAVAEAVAGKDSGVQACEAIRDAEQEPASSDEPWTPEEYQEMRQLFADSKHEAIRDNGVELVDIGWQLEQMGDDAGLEALPLLGSFMDAYAGLTGGCAEQGVVIPPIEFESPATSGR